MVEIKQVESYSKEGKMAKKEQLVEEPQVTSGKEVKEEAPKDVESKEAKEEAPVEDAPKEEPKEKPKEEKPKEEPKPEEKPKEEPKPKEPEEEIKISDEDIKTYSADNEISEDEARSELESIGRISKKYENDPKKLAKANLHIQRLHAKTQDDLKKIKATPPPRPVKEPTTDDVLKAIDNGKMKIKGEVITLERAIELYRNNHPKLSEGMNDDAVLQIVADKMLTTWNESHREAIRQGEIKLQGTAKEKRVILVKDLPEGDKPFAGELKDILDNMPDEFIAQEDFDVNEVLLNIKGTRFENLNKTFNAKLKEAEERGFKRGQEGAKILGEKVVLPETKIPVKKNESSSLMDKLNADDRERAMQMFDGQDAMDEKAKLQAYIDIYEDEIKERIKKEGGKK